MLHLTATAVIVFASLLACVHAAVTWTATPFNPAAVPLAVRSPYLSAWLPQGSGTPLNGAWPTFWTGSVSDASMMSEPILTVSSIVSDCWLGRICQGRRSHVQLPWRSCRRWGAEGFPKESAGLSPPFDVSPRISVVLSCI